MKKLMLWVFVAAVSLMFLSSAFAWDMGSKGGKKDFKKGMDCPICHMSKMMMGGKELLATQDGGVVLMTGNKIIKYDAQLNVVKEVEVKIDMEAMKKMMEDMKNNCPMCCKEHCQGKKK